MTKLGIPTVGEHAHAALDGFTSLLDTATGTGGPATRNAALGLVRACLALMDKFPRQARREFAATLPFSSLELALLRTSRIDQESVADVIVDRVRNWVMRSPLFIEEANVHAADFLLRLEPLLDLTSERTETMHALERLHAY